MIDYLIVGGGIIGTAVARSLRERDAGSVMVLEKEYTVGEHASGRNSGVIHSGFNLKPGSVKAVMCVEGSRRLRDYCRQNNVAMNECGTYVIAHNGKEEVVLEELYQRGVANEVPDVAIISEKELAEKEPNVNAKSALYSPTGATVDQLALLESLVQDNIEKGVSYRLGTKVEGIEGATVLTNGGEVKGKHIINCAGLYADKIAGMMDADEGYIVVPFRGEYYEVKGSVVNSMVYQSPDLRYPFLNVHLTRETDGRVLAGPSTVLSFGRESYDKQVDFSETFEMLTSQNFLRMLVKPSFLKMTYHNFKTSMIKKNFLREIQSIVPSVSADDILPSRAGIRAQMVARDGKLLEDMLVVYHDNSTHILNAVSPGMTCSLAFGDMIVENMHP